MTPEVVDSSGREIRLTGILGKGGEGSVYGISSTNEIVAKIYHQPLSADRSAKIELMAGSSNAAVRQLSAWPLGLLLSKSGRAPVGLLMPRVSDAKDVHKLYSPKSRQSEFQKADWRFLVRAATNTAKSFGAVHSTGCVIGDVNEGSVLVSQDATVKLIDCDSFQVIARGHRFACEVGVETFTPPELQGKKLRDVIRTTNHDDFGLAVMIFLMLFMGRHPFAGKYLGRGDMPIQKAISESRFAYSAMRADVDMDRPPGTPPLSIVGDRVAFLFERAFAKQMIQGGRPDPLEWVEALSSLEKDLKQCNSIASHWHHRDQACPWCPMEASTGVELFPYVPARGMTPSDMTAFWRQVNALQNPGPAPTIRLSRPPPSSEAIKLAGSYKRANIIALCFSFLVGAVALFGGLNAPMPLLLLFGALLTFFGARKWLDKSSDVYKLRDAKTKAETRWTEAQKQWNERAGFPSFDEKRSQLLQVKIAIDQLSSVRKARLDQLTSSLRQAQLVRYLDQFEIAKANIDGIGQGRKGTLQSYNIETAADLLGTAIHTVPGFGPVLRNALFSWRHSLEARFVFKPGVGIDPKDTAKIDHEIAKERLRLEQAARNALAELTHAQRQVIAAREQLKAPVEAAYEAFLQADVDYKAATG